jgi:preprotein translocase subunit SecE
MKERIAQYINETRTELKKVTWPSREEIKQSTRVVIIATVLMTVFIGAVDQILSRIIKLVFGA